MQIHSSFVIILHTAVQTRAKEVLAYIKSDISTPMPGIHNRRALAAHKKLSKGLEVSILTLSFICFVCWIE